MKITFVSNYLNHHQMPLAEAFCAIPDVEFYFIATGYMRAERKELGYDDSLSPAWLLHSDNPIQAEDCRKYILDADVVIFGSAPEELLNRRKAAGRLIFRYSERPLKEGLEPAKYIPRFLKWHWRNPVGKPIYMLCASAYTASDYRKFGLFRHRAYRWGYFPTTREYPELDQLLARKKPSRILWVGRFVGLKHPDDAIRVAEILQRDQIDFQMDFIGSGDLASQMHAQITQASLENRVHLLPAMTPEEVRNHMETASIFLFTSDEQEGWGAVLNEAMNSGCAVVASDAIGAVPYLVEDQKNGLVYHTGNVEALYEKTKWLLEHPKERKTMGEAAYHTIADLWNAGTAAERLLVLAKHILDGEVSPILYPDGPCSMAERMRDNWHEEQN